MCQLKKKEMTPNWFLISWRWDAPSSSPLVRISTNVVSVRTPLLLTLLTPLPLIAKKNDAAPNYYWRRKKKTKDSLEEKKKKMESLNRRNKSKKKKKKMKANEKEK